MAPQSILKIDYQSAAKGGRQQQGTEAAAAAAAHRGCRPSASSASTGPARRRRWSLPGRFHPQLRDKNRRDIGKSQSKLTASKMETPGSPSRSSAATRKLRSSLLADDVAATWKLASSWSSTLPPARHTQAVATDAPHRRSTAEQQAETRFLLRNLEKHRRVVATITPAPSSPHGNGGTAVCARVCVSWLGGCMHASPDSTSSSALPALAAADADADAPGPKIHGGSPGRPGSEPAAASLLTRRARSALGTATQSTR
jgi:hypothetical protein